MDIKRTLAALAIAGLVLSLPLAGHAKDKGYVTIEEAISEARKKQAGKVLSATPQPQKGQYQIKMLSEDGVVRVIKIDAQTGKVKGR